MSEISNTIGQLDFIVVGAEKCGTTWLSEMLRQHPQVFIPEQKELHYFNRKFGEFPELDNYNFNKPVKWYLNFFNAAKPHQIKGEICPAYLWDDQAPARIKSFDPNLKLFMLLRNPVERTYSAYRFYVQRGTVQSGFKNAFYSHKNLLVDRSVYSVQIQRYLDLFSRENIHIFLHDDLRRNAKSFLYQFEQTLDVDEFYPENVEKSTYVTGEVRYRKLNRILSKTRYLVHKYRLTYLLDLGRKIGLANNLEMFRQKNKLKPQQTQAQKIDEATREFLLEYFLPDIVRLEKILGRDLRMWKRPV